MEIHGSLSENLHAAINSMIRLKGKAVHPDTVQYWHELLRLARQKLASSTRSSGVVDLRLADQLQLMLGQSFEAAGVGEGAKLESADNASRPVSSLSSEPAACGVTD
jgi:hypothetical protein